MVTFGVDAHKRTHTIVAVDGRGTRSVRSLSAPPAKIILVCCGGLPGSARNAVGPWRTAVISLADLSGICSRQENASFGCHRS
jgi:hypothetical protein